MVYVAVRWDGAAAKTRDSITDSLATAAVVMVEDGHDRPGLRELRRAFLWAVLPANAEFDAPEELAAALRWLRHRSLLLKALADPPVTRRVLHQLTITLDGRSAAGDTYRRRRHGLNAAIEYAVELEELAANPPALTWSFRRPAGGG